MRDVSSHEQLLPWRNSCACATIIDMQASEMAAIVEEAVAPDVSAEAQETAARLSALMRHVFLYDRGNQLRVIEESGLSMTQCKALLELGGLGEAAEPRQVSDLAERFGVSVPSMSRAVDALVKKKLVTRLEDPERPPRAARRDHRQGQAAGRHAAGRPPGRPGGVRREPQRGPAPQARRRGRRADGPAPTSPRPLST